VRERESQLLVVNLAPPRGGIVHTADRRFEPRPGHAQKPVLQVTWDGARLFCEARGKRLPTEAEWEFAARGSADRSYPWGNALPECDKVVYGRDPGQPCAGREAAPADVATAAQDRTPEGVADLAGNVGEWVDDAFTLPFYSDCDTCVDPRAPGPSKPVEDDWRVFRGSSWSNATHLRTTRRGRWKRVSSADDLGFRCASAAPP
jgi:serine/threonine-protein kinase